MPAAGYSGTPLIKKLGVKDDMCVLLINQPSNYFGLLEKDISAQFCKRDLPVDFIHLFVKSLNEFEIAMKKIKKLIKPTGMVWVSWYKKSSGIATDISENDIRNYALKNDLVDVKVCAVSELWSGLKLVVPLAKR